MQQQSAFYCVEVCCWLLRTMATHLFTAQFPNLSGNNVEGFRILVWFCFAFIL